MATMSRRIPPTPVAAPWNGSTALGWLWLSTLKATASPSPRSTTPAFSPGPCRTRGPSTGKRRSSGAECLYAQCSDQSSEKTASSKWLGSRPSSSWIRSSSPSDNPRARWRGCSATAVRCPSLTGKPDGPIRVDSHVASRYLVMLGLLAAIWGAAFMLITIGLRGFEPTTLIAGRLGSAALALALFEAARGRLRRTLARLRPYAGRLALAGLVNTAVPFFLIAWGQQYVDSNVAAILNAAAPLFTVLLAAVAVRSERVTGIRLAGFVAGFGGVVLVVGGMPGDGERGVIGGLAIVAATFFYAVGALYVSRRLQALSPLEVSLGLLTWAAVFTLPAGVVQL